MKALILTRGYPPHIYGGAGVVVDQLTQALARRMAVEVRCFGARRPRPEDTALGVDVRGYASWERLRAGSDGPRFAPALETLSIALAMARDAVDAQVAHAHTWYGDMAGLWIRMLHRIPLIVTLVLMPVLMGASAGVQVLFKKFEDTREKKFAVVDRSPERPVGRVARNAPLSLAHLDRRAEVAKSPNDQLVGPRRDEHPQGPLRRPRHHRRRERRVPTARDGELPTVRRREAQLFGDQQVHHQAHQVSRLVRAGYVPGLVLDPHRAAHRLGKRVARRERRDREPAATRGRHRSRGTAPTALRAPPAAAIRRPPREGWPCTAIGPAR